MLESTSATFPGFRLISYWKRLHVDAEGLVGHSLAAINLFVQRLRRRLCERGQYAEPAYIGYGGSQLGSSHPLHSSLYDCARYPEAR